jgi:hypothetical protein
MVMRGLMGERLLKQFLGNILHRTENDAMNETGLPENGGKTTDEPDGPEPEKAQGKQKAEEVGPQYLNGRRER